MFCELPLSLAELGRSRRRVKLAYLPCLAGKLRELRSCLSFKKIFFRRDNPQ